MRLMSQSCVRICDFLTHMIFFNSQLHAIFGVFNFPILVNIYMSGTVANQNHGLKCDPSKFKPGLGL